MNLLRILSRWKSRTAPYTISRWNSIKIATSQKGQALVEMALVLPLLLMLLFGVADFGRIFHAYLTLDHAGREAARLASVDGSDSDIQSTITTDTAGLDPSKLTVTLNPTGASNRASGTDVTVTLSYTVDFLTPLLDNMLKPITLTDKTVMRVE